MRPELGMTASDIVAQMLRATRRDLDLAIIHGDKREMLQSIVCDHAIAFVAARRVGDKELVFAAAVALERAVVYLDSRFGVLPCTTL